MHIMHVWDINQSFPCGHHAASTHVGIMQRLVLDHFGYQPVQITNWSWTIPVHLYLAIDLHKQDQCHAMLSTGMQQI